jgi:hypothetical protein
VAGFQIIWEYAGLVEQCPRFPSPKRVHEKLVINRVRAKIEPLSVRNIFECELNWRKRWPLGTSLADSEWVCEWFVTGIATDWATCRTCHPGRPMHRDVARVPRDGRTSRSSGETQPCPGLPEACPAGRSTDTAWCPPGRVMPSGTASEWLPSESPSSRLEVPAAVGTGPARGHRQPAGSPNPA